MSAATGDAGVEALEAMRGVLARLDQGLGDQRVEDAVRVDRIRLLEELKSAVAAAQAVETAAFVDSQRAARRAAGVQADLLDRGIASQVGLARRVSPHQAARYVGWCKILTTELPGTFAALRAGRTTEYRALLVARETIWLSRADRVELDAELGPRLHDLGDRAVENEAKRIAYRLDPRGYVDRLRHAANERHVSLRPAPDAMARLSALLPLTQGVAALAALTRQADALRAAGDGRGKGQLMADTLVERITGQATADQVPVQVHLVMTDRTMLAAGAAGEEPALLLADGVAATAIPAAAARRAVLDPTGETAVFLRRLYRHPTDGELTAMDSSARLFTPNQRRFLFLRDQSCRTPYCGAPIRHADHVQPADRGGPTSVSNGQGLCEACNHAKQAAGWEQVVEPDGSIVTTTPTGHQYTSRPPRPPGQPPGPLPPRRAHPDLDIRVDLRWLRAA